MQTQERRGLACATRTLAKHKWERRPHLGAPVSDQEHMPSHILSETCGRRAGARGRAWQSSAGFQSESYRMQVSADCRLTPSPPTQQQ